MKTPTPRDPVLPSDAPKGRRALEVIAASSREFSEVSGDLSALLATTARLGVEAVGDLCIVQLLSDDGTELTLGAVHHGDPEVIEIVRHIFDQPNPSSVPVARHMLDATEPIFLPHVDEVRYRKMANPRFLPLLEATGFHSFIAVPLRADGQVTGALLLTRDRGSDSYTEEDVLVAEELGIRAAIAIRNARNVAALRLSEATYRGLADSTPACVLVTAPDGTIEYANQFFLDYAGMTYDDLRERGCHVLVHPADLARVTPAREQALLAAGESVDEYRVRRHDGVYRWNLTRTARIQDEYGGAARVVSVTVDIDDRHRAEDRQRLLMEASGLAAEPFDLDATLERVVSVVVPRLADFAVTITLQDDGTPRLAALACADPEIEPLVIDAVAVSLRGLRPEFGVGRALATGESDFSPIFEADAERFTSDPAQLTRYQQLALRSYISVALKWNERIFGALALFSTDPFRRFTLEDLVMATEVAEKTSAAMEHARLYREAAEAAVQLQQANRAKDDFLSLVSHELRTPITVILGVAEVLRNRAAQVDEESRATAVNDIYAEADRLNQIVENLLTLARLETRPLEMEPVHIARVAEQAVLWFQRHHPDREVALDCAQDGAIVGASGFAVEHALRNYLSNADKYSAKGASIDVRAERSGDEVIVSVLDRGPGIAEDQAQRVFTPFYRAGSSPEAPGMGIGLAVCKRVIEANNGRVWIQARPGGGTVAAFALPLLQPEELL